jgi:hypothetical protein
LGGVDLDAEDAGELAGEMSHAAFEPVAVMLGDEAGELLDEAGAVGLMPPLPSINHEDTKDTKKMGD